MFKIAHISDTHICIAEHDRHGKKFIELLSDIKSKNCDHILLTGDVVDLPGLKDLQFVREILSQCLLLDADKISVIPGNHDIFGGAPRGPDFFRFNKNCSEINYEINLDNFIQAFKETLPYNYSFPYLKILGNTAIIGLNSVDKWSLEKNPDGSNGRISREDFDKLQSILSSVELRDKYKLILIHHHFNPVKIREDYPAHSMWLYVINWKMRLFGKKKLMKLFRKYKVNLVLHGHTHITDIYNINGVTFLNSSGCIAPITDDQVRKYNIISIPDENDIEKNISVETIII